MTPTFRRLMRYRTPCPRPCRYWVTDLRDPLGPPGRTGRHPSGPGCRSDKTSNRRRCERQIQIGGNGSAYARAPAALKCATPQCMNQRYRVTLGVPKLAVDTGGRPHKCATPQCMNQRYRVTLGVPKLAVDTRGRPHKRKVLPGSSR